MFGGRFKIVYPIKKKKKHLGILRVLVNECKLSIS